MKSDGALSTATVVATYCVCSSSMLIVNKLAVHHVRAPAALTAVQFAATSLTVHLACALSLIDVDGYEPAKVKLFVVYVLAFSSGTYCNMRVLMDANVETVIVFRACTPLAVCVFDYIFHRRALPSARSAGAMALIVFGAACYVLHDKTFMLRGVSAYFWVVLWFVLLVFQLTYGKYLVSSIGLRSTWSAVLYTNTLSLVPTVALGAASSDISTLVHTDWTAASLSLVLFSCVLGVGISWSGFKCQSLLAATTYTVIGVINKLLTVLINTLIWDQHATPVGVASLIVCLLGGSLYEQAPLRKERGESVEEENQLMGSGGVGKEPSAVSSLFHLLPSSSSRAAMNEASGSARGEGSRTIGSLTARPVV